MTTQAQTKLGYMAGVSLRSRQDASDRASETNIDNIVTKAFETYLRSFFDSTGSRRHRFVQMCPGVSQFLSDRDYDFEKDPTHSKLAIERLTERTQASVPCIIVCDTTPTLRKPGFGRSVAQSRVSEKVTANHIAIFREISVPLLVVANSKSDCHALSQALHLVLFDAVNFLIGNVLLPERGSSATWCIRIPQMIDPGTPTKDQQAGDVQQQVWSNTVTVPSFFEDSFIVAGESPSDPVISAASESIAITFPTRARVGQSVAGFVTGIPWQARVVLDDINVASLRKTDQSEYVLVMRRPGTVRVQVVHGTTKNAENQGSTIQPEVLCEHTITVTF